MITTCYSWASCTLARFSRAGSGIRPCILLALTLLVSGTAVFSAKAQTCCSYLTPRLEWNSGDCCFDFYVDVEPGMPCEITRARIRTSPPGIITFATAEPGFNWFTISNGVIWEKIGTQFDPGAHFLGSVCFSGADPCMFVTIDYFDFNTGNWVCALAQEVCCNSAPTGSICGIKFEDLNGNGVQDANEPGLAGWTIKLINNATGEIIETTTNPDGSYCFNNLIGGSWSLYEVQQPGWVQTLPATGLYRITLDNGENLTEQNFGNRQACANPEELVVSAGRNDNFDTSEGDEPASPGADLVTYRMSAYPSSVENNFDGTSDNRAFIHTMNFPLPEECFVVGATLRLHLKTLSPGSSNDDIRIVENGVGVWGMQISTILGYTWFNADAIITIDLANLPAGSIPANILSTLQDGDLDIFIQDDTSIDWIELTLQICCGVSECCEYLTPEFQRVGDSVCCFDFYVDMNSDIPCNITATRFEVLGAFTVVPYYASTGFTVSQNGNTVSWDKNGLTFDAGSNYIGAFCIEGPEPCATIVVQYFDQEYQRWICSDTLTICCPIENGAVCGTKFEDLDCDGIQDPDEPGLEGWQIVIYNKDTGLRDTVTTDAQGNYCFNNLPEAAWCISEIQQPGWVQTFPPNVYYYVVLASNQTINSLDFGNYLVCSNTESMTLLAGNKDNFSTADGVEASTPGDDLMAYRQLAYPHAVETKFDGTVKNRAFIHTFSGFLPEGCCVVGARLRMRIKTLGSDSYNDYFNLPENGGFVWAAFVTDLVGYNWVNSTAILDLDLANLPGTEWPNNILATLQDGDFDVFIQDDTSVDWIELELELCCQEEESACCSYLEPTLNAGPNPGCCFDLTLALDPGMPCEIMAVRISTDGQATVSGALAEVGYTITSQTATEVSFAVDGAYQFAAGTHGAGSVCFTFNSPEDCKDFVIDYYDANSGQWVCPTTRQLCCPGVSSDLTTGLAEGGHYSNPAAGIFHLGSVPNPARDYVTLAYELGTSADIRLVLLDALGQVALELDKSRKEAGRHSLAFETSALPAGSYYIQLSTARGTASCPLLIVR